jgi:hypothetical protein
MIQKTIGIIFIIIGSVSYLFLGHYKGSQIPHIILLSFISIALVLLGGALLAFAAPKKIKNKNS